MKRRLRYDEKLLKFVFIFVIYVSYVLLGCFPAYWQKLVDGYPQNTKTRYYRQTVLNASPAVGEIQKKGPESHFFFFLPDLVDMC